MKRLSDDYVQWLRAHAQVINSDGCTLVTQVYQDCCLEHDLSYYYGKDPRVAYASNWQSAPAMDRKEADRRFRNCVQAHSRLGKYSPVSWLRWSGVRLAGWHPWNKHRKRG